VATLHVQSGWVPPDTRVDEMESAVRTICEPIFDRPLKEISFGTVLLRLFEALRRFNGQIQPQLLLLQKTLLNIEGLGRQLYPELDIWHTASPVLRRWMRDRMSPRNVLRELRRGWPDALEIIKALPPLAKRMLERAQDGQLSIPIDTQAVDQLRRDWLEQCRRSDRALLGAVLWLGGILWLGLHLEPQPIGLVLGAVGVGLWLSLWRPRSR
jgi:ubiquinone biosynthesis protein